MADKTPIPAIMSNTKFFGANFSGADLRKRDLRRSTFMQCNFDGADLTEADGSGSEFYGSTFRQTNLHGCNFKDAKLHGTVFEPSDCYGMTLTMHCQTFTDVKISRVWWDAFVFILCGLMVPEKDADGFDPRDGVIHAIGRDYFVRQYEKFKARTL